MKDELPIQPESQDQDAASDSYNTFGSSNKSTEPFVSSAPITSVAPLVDTEVEPPTSSLGSTTNSPAIGESHFFSGPTTSSDFSSPIVDPAPLATDNNFGDQQPEVTPVQPETSITPLAPVPETPVLAQSTEPVVPVAAPFGGVSTPPKKSKRKKFIVIGALVGMFALLGGTSAAAYNLWYQNPDKVLSDALVNALKAKTVTYTGSFNLDYSDKNGTYGSSTEGLKLNVKVDGKNAGTAGEVNVTLAATYQDEDFGISGSGLIDKDANLFIKVNDVKKLLQTLPAESGMSYDELPSYITAIVDKVDSRWIRISADDIKEFSDDYAKTQTCIEDVSNKLQDDKALSNELLNAYRDNKFVIVKERLPAKDGSLGYVIDVDESKSKAFAKAADNTKFGKELQKCDDSFKFSSNSSSSSSEDLDTKTRVELWANRWSHQLTKASFSATDDEADGLFVFEPTFNQAVSVEAPKEFIPLKDLKTDIEDAYAQYMTQLMSGSINGSPATPRDVAIESYKLDHEGKEPSEAEIQQIQQSFKVSSGQAL